MTRISGMICKDCKQPFTMEAGEILWFEKRNMEQPKRCPACRKKRKEAKK